jgi:hypothetical protein
MESLYKRIGVVRSFVARSPCDNQGMTNWDQAARELLEEARRRAGGGSALATALCEAGVGPESGAYSESAVSNWIKGRTKPHANVLLAACNLYSLSIDRRLAGEDSSLAREASQPAESELSRMRADIDRLAQLVTHGAADRGRARTQDVVAVYGTRAEAQAAEPVLRTVAAAQQIDTMGLSLNSLCQGISDVTMVELIESGLMIRAAFLDPDSTVTRAREQEEGHRAGELRDLTKTNMRMLERVRARLSEEAVDRLQVRTYAGPLRLTLMIADHRRAHVQWYLPHARGIDSPTIVVEADERYPHGLFPVVESIFAQTWEQATA